VQKGDGITDDTTAVQNALTAAATAGKIVFFDAGTYQVTKTLFVPKGSKILGESYAVIMSRGAFFADISKPQVVVKVGNPGTVEWSDMIVSTQGAQAGAILIQWNLAATAAAPSGMWDVHTRIGGFVGSNLQLAQCKAQPGSSAVVKECYGAYLSLHGTKTAQALYMEHVWLWTADHDVDDPGLGQITVSCGEYGGRFGCELHESCPLWMDLPC